MHLTNKPASVSVADDEALGFSTDTEAGDLLKPLQTDFERCLYFSEQQCLEGYSFDLHVIIYPFHKRHVALFRVGDTFRGCTDVRFEIGQQWGNSVFR